MQKYFLFLWIGFLSACLPNKQTPPKDLIPFEKMQLILQDILIADGLANREGEEDRGAENETKILYREVFSKHQVSEMQFFSSHEYYLKHPEILDSIFNNLIIEISKQQAVIQAEKDEQNK